MSVWIRKQTVIEHRDGRDDHDQRRPENHQGTTRRHTEASGTPGDPKLGFIQDYCTNASLPQYIYCTDRVYEHGQSVRDSNIWRSGRGPVYWNLEWTWLPEERGPTDVVQKT